ncbi:MAG: CrcB protein [Natronomonas sp.]|jgi:CrcB protein
MTGLQPRRLEAITLVGIGGFAGANLRYLVELLVPATLVATALINILGSAALGFIFYESRFSGGLSASGRRVLATGLLSSFTTYSTFVVDAVLAEPLIGAGYVAGSYALGFLGVLVGREVALLAGGER